MHGADTASVAPANPTTQPPASAVQLAPTNDIAVRSLRAAQPRALQLTCALYRALRRASVLVLKQVQQGQHTQRPTVLEEAMETSRKQGLQKGREQDRAAVRATDGLEFCVRQGARQCHGGAGMRGCLSQEGVACGV